MKRQIDIFEYAGHICSAMKKGILLTTKSGETVNTMTIGWGTLGIEWGRKLFIAYVRESRFTKELLESTGEFTVNVPYGDLDNKIIRYCGSKSGRETDKIKDLDLTLEQPNFISVPGIKELPLTLECKVLYKQTQHSHHRGYPKVPWRCTILRMRPAIVTIILHITQKSSALI